ncbi:hypothetical protein FEE95_20395 [Maribacter algarum]|uniref:Uncharacterized protein n=1 Tax=Maribacter algarum (ex Zhang et al. 2020) TaxID=2578118 RepID=A0A5S3Q930_9FLAO|nr:hypothetical protein [Maribacter algarum]TMM53421.1 hypothetical protein FEE95_20395 [Maribacter algarum]
MRKLLFIVLIGILLMGNRTVEVPMDNPPEYFVLSWKEGTQLTPQPTEFFIEVDSTNKQEILALVNERKVPVLYTSEITTPVCADGECKLMNIKFYWTLLGEYAGFDRYPTMPLTKHDHDEFGEADYQKLHRLLADDKNLMGRRRIDQLVEKPKMRTVNGVDAVSGATIARVKESVVSGALYSCYTAWHLVHGDIQEQLKTHSLSILDRQMILDMLYSINPEYQIFAMGKMDRLDYKEHYKQLADVFRTSTPLVRSIITKRLTTKFKDAPKLQRPFWEAFDVVDASSKSQMMKYLDEAPNYVLEVLSEKLGVMSKNQIKAFLTHLSNSEVLNAQTLNNILEFSKSENQTYAYLAQEFLEDLK